MSLLAPSALAQVGQPVGPYDGENPFNCEIQDVGTGTDFPAPRRRPVLRRVRQDEPERHRLRHRRLPLAGAGAVAATPVAKCFYFQRDHWTGSVIQGQAPEVWHWDGSYFFDSAKGIGGVSVRNFRIGGQPADATPYVPPGYAALLRPNGGGGGRDRCSETDPDPDVRRQGRHAGGATHQVYGDRAADPQCIEPGGRCRGRQVGQVKLGARRASAFARSSASPAVSEALRSTLVRGRQGEPARRLRAQASPREADPVDHRGSGRSTGCARRIASRRPPASTEAPTRFRVRARRSSRVPRKPRAALFVGLRNGRVRWIAIANAHPGPRRTFRRAL